MWLAQRLEVRFITLLFRPQRLKVRFITLAVCYNKTIAKQSRTKQNRKAGVPMTAQFRYVAGHIEVYSAAGEFLFSADTMQEAWEDYQDEMSA